MGVELPPFALFDEFGRSCDDRVQDHYHAAAGHAGRVDDLLSNVEQLALALSGLLKDAEFVRASTGRPTCCTAARQS